MKVGIIARFDKKSLEFVNYFYKILEKKGFDVYFEKDLSGLLGINKVFDGDMDFIFWVGGDGTLLKFVNYLANFNSKLLGIRLNSIGFLCEIYPNEVESAIDRLLKNDYYEDKRSLLEINYESKIYFSLNDVVAYTVNLGKTSVFTLKKENMEIFSGKCDGILISTTTGSTAYIASRGGPIVDPSLDLIIIDPLNPLKWGSRSIIIPFNSSISLFSNNDYNLIIDGNIKFYVKKDNEIKIKGSNKKLTFIRFSNDFYERLKKRMFEDV